MNSRNHSGFALMPLLILLVLVVVAAVGVLYVVQSGSLLKIPFMPTILHQVGYKNIATLSGTVTEGPIAPLCTAAAPCSRVVGDRIIEAEDTNGTAAASTRTGSDGSYTLYLAPGTYRLVSVPAIGLGPSQPVTVHAGANHFDLVLDTGIR